MASRTATGGIVQASLRRNSEVDRFRVQVRDRLLIECFAGPEAPQSGDGLGVRAAVRRADADEHAIPRTGLLQMKGKRRTGMHGDRNDVGAAPGMDFDVRDEARDNRIGDEVRDALLSTKDVRHADDPACLVLDAHEHRPAGGVGERDEGPQEIVR